MVEEKRWETLAYKLEGIVVCNNQWLGVDVVCCRQQNEWAKSLKDLQAWLRWDNSNKRSVDATMATFRALKALQELGEQKTFGL